MGVHIFNKENIPDNFILMQHNTKCNHTNRHTHAHITRLPWTHRNFYHETSSKPNSNM